MRFSFLISVSEIRSYLKDSILSILDQNYSDFFEIKIIDDGIEKFNLDNYLRKELKFHNKFNYIDIIKNEKNIGLTNSLNKGIEYCKGDFIVRLDDDDISETNRLLELSNIIDSNKDIKLIASSHFIINENGKVIGKRKIDIKKVISRHKYKNLIAHSSTCFNKKFIQEIGKYNINFLYSQDYELWNRILSKHPETVFISKKNLVKIRYHKNTISSKYSINQRFNSIKICLATKFKDNYNEFINHNQTDLETLLDETNNTRILKYYEALKFSYLYDKKINIKFNLISIFYIFLIFSKNTQLLFKNIYYRTFIN